MMPSLSSNAQAILLLSAPLIAGRSAPSADLLSPRDYKRLARHLREMERQPADLLSPDAADLLRACRPLIEEERLRRLLGRGFLLSQVIERWQARAIWVVSRADASYPRRLKARLREDAPPVLYGCGDINLLESGGLAVVGSRHVDDALVDYTMDIGRLAARARATLISGGARGIDQAAMRGALEAGGNAIGVLADSLEKTAMNREHRNLLVDGQLALLSPYNPSAGFNVGNAMQRNTLIYALADAALVVSSDLDKGGTWAGATEQLDKLNLVPVYVRSTGAASAGLDALRKKGALSWPNPRDVDEFGAVFEPSKAIPSLFSDDTDVVTEPTPQRKATPETEAGPNAEKQPKPLAAVTPEDQMAPCAAKAAPSTPAMAASAPAVGSAAAESKVSPAFAVREAIQLLLVTPMKEAEVASALNVSKAQAKVWLQRLVDKGLLEKQKKPAGYIVRQLRLFD